MTNYLAIALLATSLILAGMLDLADQYRDWETDRKSTRLNSSH